MHMPAGAKVSTIDDGPLWAAKSEWGPGPWEGEPDRVEWRIPGTLHGLVCLAARGSSGGWCGYVGVPPGHPAHGKDYDDVDVDVHGGLTFADKCQTHEGALVCHVPEPGEPDDVWWLGFDCAHSQDYSPGMEARLALSARSLLSAVERGERKLDPPIDMEWLREHSRAPQYIDPAVERAPWFMGGTYRPFGYVREEVEGLALQLAVMARRGLVELLRLRCVQMESLAP